MINSCFVGKEYLRKHIWQHNAKERYFAIPR